MISDSLHPSSAAPTLADRILRQLRQRGGLTAVMRTTGPELARVYGSRGSVWAVRDASRTKGFLWACGDAPETLRVPRYSEPGPSTMDLFFAGPSGDWLLERGESAGAAWRLNVQGKGERDASPRLIRQVSRLTPGSTLANLISVQIPPVGEWTGRFLLFDSSRGDTRTTLSSVASLARHVGPSMLAKHENRQLRERVRAEERASLARDLHDGVIQSLLGVGLRLHSLHRRHQLAAPARSALQALEREVHDQVVSLRRLIENLRPDDLQASQLCTYVDTIVDRFRRETGIAVTLDAVRGEDDVAPATCLEIIRVLQESLANIRRHSGARSVHISLTTSRGDCLMTIADDGRGFPFEGRLTLDDLEQTLQGPRVIKERVRALGGDLSIESGASGSRLEIRFPVSAGYAVA